MILIAHLLFGALIGQKIANPFLAVILAFLGHYFLDLIPHNEYDIDKINQKQWKGAGSQITNVLLDFLSGILLIFLFSNNQFIIYICAFFAILPDGLSILSLVFQNKILCKHGDLHQQKIHFLKHKKISKFWRIATQVVVVIISVVLLNT